MPENETLAFDVRTANRWQQLKARIERGESLIAIFPEFQNNFYQMLRQALKQWEQCGVGGEALLAATMHDREELQLLVTDCRFDSFAMVLETVAATARYATRETPIRAFLDQVWDCVRDLMQLDCCDDGVSQEFEA